MNIHEINFDEQEVICVEKEADFLAFPLTKLNPEEVEVILFALKMLNTIPIGLQKTEILENLKNMKNKSQKLEKKIIEEVCPLYDPYVEMIEIIELTENS